MGCCDSVIKTLLFIFNLVVVLCGLAILTIGAVLLAQAGDFNEVIDEVSSGLKAPQIALIVLGSVIFLIAFLGCCGAIQNSKCMLITYAVCLLVIFIIQLAIGIWAVVNFNGFETKIHQVLNDYFQKIPTDEDAKKVFDSLQKTLHCCGVNGPTDYGLKALPPSCCKNVDYAICLTPYETGCADALTDFTSDAGKIMGGVAIGLAIVEVIGIIFACRLARKDTY